jgi:hypothetical protein
LEEAASLSIVVESGIDLSEFAPRLVRVTYSVWFGADIERAQIDAFLARVEVRGAVYHDGVLIAGTEDAGPCSSCSDFQPSCSASRRRSIA